MARRDSDWRAGATLASVVQSKVVGDAIVFAAAGAAAGAINGAISGGYVGVAAAVGAGVSLVAHLLPVSKLNEALQGAWGAVGVNAQESAIAIAVNRLVKNAATGAFFGAGLSGMTGGDMLQGAATGALAWGVGEAATTLLGSAIGFALTGQLPTAQSGLLR